MSDMSGRLCLVTGATRGLGRMTAEALAGMGAGVVVHGRSAALVDTVCKVISLTTGNAGVTGIVADMSSLDDVRRLADEILSRHERIDVLVNNAGLARMHRVTSADGHELQLAVNHLAPFLLTNLLLERIRASAPARIVTVASAAHRRASIDFDDLEWERRKYDGLQAYGASKLANILFTKELARRLDGTGVTANCLHPGVVATNIFSNLTFLGKLFTTLARPFMLSAEKGAQASVFLASSPDVTSVSGKYFDKCQPVEPAPAARDSDAAERLWALSEKLTGLA
jgi:retinol dehydrogenase-12